MNRNAIHHIYNCNANKSLLTKEEIKLKYIIHNFGEEITKKIIDDYTNLCSLPMIKDKYGIDYKSILFILSLNNIRIRDISESSKKISVAKSKKTCIEKYGVENPSQADIVKEKKRNTFATHYGVDNIWKIKDYTREVWKKFSDDKKEEIIKKRYESINKNKTFGSKIELKVIEILDNLSVPYQRQFLIESYSHPYDIHLTGTKIIIEVNGRWWHADPRYYSDNDIMNQPGSKRNIKAKDIWRKDSKWLDYATKKGYRVIVLWEDDITSKNDEELTKYIINKINE